MFFFLRMLLHAQIYLCQKSSKDTNKILQRSEQTFITGFSWNSCVLPLTAIDQEVKEMCIVTPLSQFHSKLKTGISGLPEYVI